MRQIPRYMLMSLLPRRFLLTRGPRRSQDVAVTFDDGPHPEHTPRLLDVLDQLAIKATFFVVGCKATRYPQIIRRIADEGHALGCHTWTHPDTAQISTRAFAEEVERTNDLLAEITGIPVRFFRPRSETQRRDNF